MLKAGNSNWECSPFINNSAHDILSSILLPNLSWKAGQMESAIRKIALVACYALLKAGSIKTEILFKQASVLVPAIVSHLGKL